MYKGKSDKFSFSMTVSLDTKRRIKELKKQSGSNNFGETINKALQLLEWYHRMKDQGNQLAVTKDGKVTEYNLVFIGDEPILTLVK